VCVVVCTLSLWGAAGCSLFAVLVVVVVGFVVSLLVAGYYTSYFPCLQEFLIHQRDLLHCKLHLETLKIWDQILAKLSVWAKSRAPMMARRS
jgi:hypothetical protein